MQIISAGPDDRTPESGAAPWSRLARPPPHSRRPQSSYREPEPALRAQSSTWLSAFGDTVHTLTRRNCALECRSAGSPVYVLCRSPRRPGPAPALIGGWSVTSRPPPAGTSRAGGSGRLGRAVGKPLDTTPGNARVNSVWGVERREGRRVCVCVWGGRLGRGAGKQIRQGFPNV